MTYEADDLTRARIEEIRHLATVKKVDGMLVQEWEIVALCDRALRSETGECGHWNGPNLAHCGMCQRAPNETPRA